ncbi:MAG: ABC transporter permease [Thermoanaerobaculia bacterium]
MQNWFGQVVALFSFNIRTLPSRLGSAGAAVFGIAGVVAVLVGVLSIGEGFERAMTVAGSEDTAVVLRAGSDSEMTSILGRTEARIIESAPGVAKKDGKALVSPELFVIVNLPKRSTGTDANVPLRGVEEPAIHVREGLRIVEGRMFQRGRNEVIAGRGAQISFAGIDVGNELRLGQTRWTVVGIFEEDGGLAESEMWGDVAVIGPAYQRGTSYQTVIAKLASPGSFNTFKDALTADPRLNVKVVRETEYYAEQSRLIVMIVTGLATIVSLLMGAGAVFGALNTMYTAVAARSREIATLEALGFGRSPVVLSVVLESLLLAAIGGLLGAVGAWLAFDGYRAATMNWQSFSQVAFAFDVSPALLGRGIFYALVIGAIGGLLPAIRAVRTPVSVALREP